MNAPHTAHARQLAAAALIARWFHTNPGAIETYTLEPAPDGTWIAVATLRQPLTPEEHALYVHTLEGGQP